jgi:hypothetical protein
MTVQHDRHPADDQVADLGTLKLVEDEVEVTGAHGDSVAERKESGEGLAISRS